MPERARIPCIVPGCGSYRQGDWLAHEASQGHRRALEAVELLQAGSELPRIDGIDHRVGEIDVRVTQIDERVTNLEQENSLVNLAAGALGAPPAPELADGLSDASWVQASDSSVAASSDGTGDFALTQKVSEMHRMMLAMQAEMDALKVTNQLLALGTPNLRAISASVATGGHRRVVDAAVAIQRSARGRTAKVKFERARRGATKVQSMARCWRARSSLQGAKNAVAILAAAARRRQASLWFASFRASAIKAQALSRGTIAVKKFKRILASAKAAQRVFRGHRVRRPRLLAQRSRELVCTKTRLTKAEAELRKIKKELEETKAELARTKDPVSITTFVPKSWTASDARRAGCSASEAKRAGLITSAVQAKRLGYPLSEVKAAGLITTVAEAKRLGWPASDVKAAGWSASDAKAAGFLAREIFPLCLDTRVVGQQGVFWDSRKGEFGELCGCASDLWSPNGRGGLYSGGVSTGHRCYDDQESRILAW